MNFAGGPVRSVLLPGHDYSSRTVRRVSPMLHPHLGALNQSIVLDQCCNDATWLGRLLLWLAERRTQLLLLLVLLG